MRKEELNIVKLVNVVMLGVLYLFGHTYGARGVSNVTRVYGGIGWVVTKFSDAL